jgi:hypothetical protein
MNRTRPWSTKMDKLPRAWFSMAGSLSAARIKRSRRDRSIASVVAPVPQPISKTLKEPPRLFPSTKKPATKPPTRSLIAAAAGQIRSSMWYSVPIGPEKRRSAWAVEGFGSEVKACWVKEILLARILTSGRWPDGRSSGRRPRSHRVATFCRGRLFLGRRVVRFDHEVDRHAVQFLEHKRAIDH